MKININNMFLIIKRTEDDPQDNTKAQKTWLPNNDPALLYIESKLESMKEEAEDLSQTKQQILKSKGFLQV